MFGGGGAGGGDRGGKIRGMLFLTAVADSICSGSFVIVWVRSFAFYFFPLLEVGAPPASSLRSVSRRRGDGGYSICRLLTFAVPLLRAVVFVPFVF